jgi:hypothetical protein
MSRPAATPKTPATPATPASPAAPAVAVDTPAKTSALTDFAKTVAAAVKYDNVEPAGPKKLIATEFVWLTNPPGRVSVGGAKFGIAPTLAGQYTSETIYRLYRWGVAGAVWYGLRDRPNEGCALRNQIHQVHTVYLHAKTQ